MKMFCKVFLFTMFTCFLYADSLSVNKSGWSLIANPYNEQNASLLSSNADLIFTYKNNKWQGISPNNVFTQKLKEKNIEAFSTLDANDAFWIFFENNNNNTITFDGSIEAITQLFLRKGWNLVSISSFEKYIVPSFYLKDEDVFSVWTYDNFYGKWRGYSPSQEIQDDIKSDENLSFINTISYSDALWINSKKDINISIENLAAFFTNSQTTYNIDEKEINNFKIEALDPNGDSITYTITGEDASFFQKDISSNSVKFIDINSKPSKSTFNISISLEDGVHTINKDFTINVKLRYENNYTGIYSKISTKDNDEDLKKQWYLDASHLDILSLHKDYNGSSEHGATIQIVEAGFQTTHPDLIANMDYSMAYDYALNIDGNTTSNDNSHGTSSAGIIGARGFNDIGIRGIVPFGKITGFKFKTNYDNSLNIGTSAIKLAWAYGPRANDIDISNNSWTTCKSFSLGYSTYMEYGSKNLRDKKGRIYVISAGNDRSDSSKCGANNTNLNTNLNNPYSIVVAAMKKDDTISSTSTPGANILVSAYGQDGIWTTFGENNLEYAAFGGTSAAAPMVSGGIGLVLEACPTLTYRDVKYILAKTATKVDTSSNTWVNNSEDIAYSTDYGFGKLNVKSSINMCKTNYTNLIAQTKTSQRKIINESVALNGATLSIDIDISENIKVEYVAVYFNVVLDDLGDFEFTLISPSQTSIKLLHGNNGAKSYDIREEESSIEDNARNVFRLSTMAMLNEDSAGTWTIKIADKNTSNNQSNSLIKEMRLDVLGY